MCLESCAAIQIASENLLPFLDEKQKRLWVAKKAMDLGWVAISRVLKITNISRNTIGKEISEINGTPISTEDLIRKTGGRKKKLEKHYPSLRDDILKYLSSTTRDDPEPPQRWTG